MDYVKNPPYFWNALIKVKTFEMPTTWKLKNWFQIIQGKNESNSPNTN